MQDNTYTINSVDDQGNANITYQVWGQQYTQDLMNLPVSDAPSLQAALSQYVASAQAQLAPPPADTAPQAVASLVGQTITISTPGLNAPLF